MLKVTQYSTHEIKPYKGNTKVHTIEQINNVAKSINENGWVQPIVIDKDGEIVIGHCRYEAAKTLGLKEVPVAIFQGTKEQAKKLRILDNKLNESDWDFRQLAVELEGVDFDDYAVSWDFPSDWFQTRDKNDTTRQDGNEEYNEFLEKFEAKKTTDDCYTPDIVYDAIADYVAERYGLKRTNFVRPFYPGGDYQKEKYREADVVVDNPPFSICTEIMDFYNEHGIRYFMFCDGLTGMGRVGGDREGQATLIVANASITYENGAIVNTNFVTNLEDKSIVCMTAPTLRKIVVEADKENQKYKKAEIPVYDFPNNVVTIAMLSKFVRYGVEYKVEIQDQCLIRELDQMKEYGKVIYGGGLILSEKAAAEKAAAEKAAAEKAAAEKAAAEKVNKKVWQLSEREKAIVASLGKKKT